MAEPTTLLALCILVTSLVIALLSACVPALWWLYFRQRVREEEREKRVAELEKDVKQLDQLIDRVYKVINVNREE